MPRKHPTPAAIFDQLIAAVLHSQPVNDTELFSRLDAYLHTDVRRSLVMRLERGGVPVADSQVFTSALWHVGIGRFGARLRRIAAEADRPHHERAIAMRALTNASQLDPAALNALAETPGMADLAEREVEDMLGALQVDEGATETLATVVEMAPPEHRMKIVAMLDAKRQRAGTPAARAWGFTLRTTVHADLRAFLLERVVEDGGREARSLVEDLRNAELSPEIRHLYQSAYMALRRTREPGTAPRAAETRQDGTAWIATCDGQSAFIMITAMKNADGSLTLGDLCIRANADIRDGFVIPRPSDDDVAGMLAQIGEGAFCRVVPATPGDAALVVHDALARMDAAGIGVPPDARVIVDAFERMAPTPSVVVPENPALPDFPFEVFEDLVESREYTSWFFDRGDLASVGVPVPRRRLGKGPSKPWVKRALAAFDTPIIRARIVAMARHSAWLAALEGDAELATMFAAAARKAATSVRESSIVRVMVERAGDGRFDDDRDPGVPSEFGSPGKRRAFKQDWFRHITKPVARDVAMLDYMDAAESILEEELNALGGDLRPRQPDRIQAAHDVAALVVKNLFSKERTPILDAIPEIRDALLVLGPIDRKSLESVATRLATALEMFREEICEGLCPVRCLRSKATAPMREAFFDTHHPAQQTRPPGF